VDDIKVGTNSIVGENNVKKITHLLYSGLGGHGSVFFSLVKADQQHEFATEAIFCGIEEVRKDYILQCEELRVPYKMIKKKPGVHPGVFLKLYRAFSNSKPDTLFLHGATFIIPAIVYKTFRGKVKLIVRDTQAHHLKTKREWFWLRLAIRFADQLVFLTRESLEGVHQKIKTKRLEMKAVIIPNGLDTSLYSPAPARDINSIAVIGMQSRLQPIKDHPVLLKAFALLKAAIPRHRLYLRIAGDGETLNDLKVLTLKLGIQNEVEFCGMLNENDLIGFMQSLDIYVHATFGETMSNSIMQAMACGLPVVASNVWGVSNMIRNDVNGLLYVSGDATELCDKLCGLVRDDSLRKRLSDEARKYAVEQYSLPRLFQKYNKIV
jgi:glycosyltransferase involved in cell wall biosynthesis